MRKGYDQILAIMLFLILATGMAGCADNSQATVDIESFSYLPDSINVTPGTIVTWIDSQLNVQVVWASVATVGRSSSGSPGLALTNTTAPSTPP